MLFILHVALLGLLVVFVLVSTRRTILSPPLMYFVGTAFFLFVGAVTGTAELWEVKEGTAWLAFGAVVVSGASLTGAYALARSIKPQLSRPPVQESVISNRTLTALFVASVLIKAFLDPDSIVGAVFTDVAWPDTVVGLYLSALVQFPTALACLCPWFWRRAKPGSWVARSLVAGCGIVGLVSFSRTPVFYVLGTWLLFLAWHTRSIWIKPHVRLGMIALIVAVSPALVFLAALIKGSNLLVETVASGRGLHIETIVEFAVRSQYELAVSDAYGNFLYIIDNYPHVHDYMPGLTPAVLATAVIPRSIFEWKPWSASYHVTNQILGAGTYESTGVSLATSFLGDLWINGGWIAIVMGSAVLGIVGAQFTRFAHRNRGSTLHELIYMMSLVMLILIPRGDVFSTFFRGISYILAALVIGYCLRTGSPRPTPLRAPG